MLESTANVAEVGKSMDGAFCLSAHKKGCSEKQVKMGVRVLIMKKQ